MTLTLDRKGKKTYVLWYSSHTPSLSSVARLIVCLHETIRPLSQELGCRFASDTRPAAARASAPIRDREAATITKEDIAPACFWQAGIPPRSRHTNDANAPISSTSKRKVTNTCSHPSLFWHRGQCRRTDVSDNNKKKFETGNQNETESKLNYSHTRALITVQFHK